jgi:trehalose 6-phosphate phosphatase
MAAVGLPGSRDILRRLSGAERVFWFIDFDGTLVPIVRRPELVVFGDDSREALRALSLESRSRVAVVSGRPLAFVRRRIGLRGLVYAGNHGLEVRGPGVEFRHPGAVAARPSLLQIKRAWLRMAPGLPGSIVEDKGMSVTFHYRRVRPSRQEEARLLALETAGAPESGGAIRLTAGKKIVEARPAVNWGKGEALGMLLEEGGYRRGKDLVAAFGDDETDRDMFRLVKGEDLAVFVGRGDPPPEANARLGGPASLTRLLGKAAALRGHR